MKGFQRIQDYLLREEKNVFYLTQGLESSHQHLPDLKLPVTTSAPDLKEKSIERTSSAKFAILRDVSGPLSEEKASYFRDLSLDIDLQRITMVTGPVGCGKSLFLKLLLHEISYSGVLWTSAPRAAYCSQTPWLAAGTIRDNILGSSLWDGSWYNDVLSACALDKDIEDLPEGDATQVGVRGSRISGGQQVRVVSHSDSSAYKLTVY